MEDIGEFFCSLSTNGDAKGQKQMKNKNGLEVATKPQLELFGSFPKSGHDDLVQYSSAFTSSLWMWEEIPKYVFTKWLVKSLMKEGKNRIYTIPFKLSLIVENGRSKEVDAKVEITPATIKTSDGGEKICYPGETEEFVEEALKLLIMRGKGELVLDNEPTNKVFFTLRDIKRELKAKGRDRTIGVIKEAIEVMEKCNLKITTSSGRSISTNLLGGVKTIPIAEYKELKAGRVYESDKGLDYIETEDEQGQRLHEVALPELVSQSIATMRYRSINSEILFGVGGLARDIYRRLSNRFIQAGPGGSGYDLRLSHMKNTGRIWKINRTGYIVEQAAAAMNELVEKGAIEPNWTSEKIMDPLDRRSLIDIKYHFKPTALFIKYQKQSNFRTKLLHDQRRNHLADTAMRLVGRKKKAQ